MNFRIITGLLLVTAAGAVILHNSCVDNAVLPEEEAIAWIEIPVPRSACNLYALSLASNGRGVILHGAKASHNLWRSNDRGEMWEEKDLGLNPHCDVTVLLVKGGDKVFAGLSGGGIFLTHDDGDTWTQVNNHLTDLDIRSMTASAGGDIMAGTDNGRMFRSADDGGLWTQVMEESIETPVSALAADSAGILYAGCLGQGVFISEDGGVSWIEHMDGLENLDVRCLTVHGGGSIMAGTNGGGIYRSPGGTEPWTRIDGGATESDITAISSAPSGNVFAGTNGDGVIRSRDGDDSWERADNGLQGLEIRSLLCDDGIVLAGTNYCGLFRSLDGGESWIAPKEHESDYFAPRNCRWFSIDSSGSYYLLRDRDIIKSSDGGGSWVRACHGIADSYYPDTDLHCIAVHPDGPLFVGTDSGIFVSADHGNLWSRADTFSAEPPAVALIEVAANGIIFCCTKRDLLRSDTGGASWEYVNEESSIKCICSGSGGCVYLGTDHGIMRSTDDGETWAQVTDSLWINSIDTDRAGTVLATSHRAVLRSRDRGDTWKLLPMEFITPLQRILSAPGGEIAIILDYTGNLYLSYDEFSSWTLDNTLPSGDRLFFGPDGHLFIISIWEAGLHRSNRPLF